MNVLELRLKNQRSVSVKKEIEELEKWDAIYRQKLLYQMIYEILKELRKLNKK
jgi:hypothetical protein